FAALESPISIGKEANIFTAKKGKDRVIVKIYRLNTCDFNKMYEYLKFDPRYSDTRRSRRQVIFTWVQREYRNLLKSREAGVRVPTPIAVFSNILVLEFIGSDEPAPKLKDLIPENLEKFFDEVILNMKKLFKAGIVHGDLSAFNILNFNDKPVFIDMSQSTTTENPRFQEYLLRDVKNVCNHFRKIGLKLDDDEVYGRIVGK
ncbi:MAG: serine protein kinase RIO, partial [Nanoarchaeota archaeon]